MASRKKRYLSLADKQLALLNKRGCPNGIIHGFWMMSARAIEHALTLDIPRKHIPFLPVIPGSYFGAYGGLMLISASGRTARGCFTPADELRDTIKTPPGLYYIFDVDPGTLFPWQRGRIHERVRCLEIDHRRLAEMDRKPINVNELISVGIFTDWLAQDLSKRDSEHTTLVASGTVFDDDRTFIGLGIKEYQPDMSFIATCSLEVPNCKLVTCQSRQEFPTN